MFDSSELTMLQDAANRFASDHTWTADADKLWAMFSEMGWLGLNLSEDEGGLGPCAVAVVMAAMGRNAISSPYIGGAVIPTRLLSACERADELSALLEGGSRIGVDASVFLPSGKARVQVTAQGEAVALSGEVLAVGWSKPDAVLVLADDEAGNRLLVLLPLAAAGISHRAVTLADKAEASVLGLANIVLPQESIIASGDKCFALIEAARTEAMIAAAADNLGAMEALFELTLNYVKVRSQFGKAIGSFQALQFRLTDMWIKLDEARCLVISAAESLAAGDAGAEHEVTAAWLQSIWSARLIREEAVQMHGAIGMTEEFEVGQFVRRLLVNELLFGTEEMNLAGYRRRGSRLSESSAAI